MCEERGGTEKRGKAVTSGEGRWIPGNSLHTGMCDSEYGILLLTETPGGLAESLSPEVLSAAHPGWAADVWRFGPWYEVIGPMGRRVWRPVAEMMDGRDPDGGQIWVCGSCGSCLDVCWAFLYESVLPEFAAVLTVSQRSGRGQLRRSWHSPPGNLYAAWVWPREFSHVLRECPALLSVAAGLAVATGLETLGVSVTLKWPNDLLWQDRKVGGLLVEERGNLVVVGVGINLAIPPPSELLREEHAVPAGSLACAGIVSSTGPLSLWLPLLAGACRFCKNTLRNTAARNIIRMAEARLAWIGRHVLACGGAGDFEKFTGIIIGIAGDGALRLLTAGGERRLTSGSIVLLP